MTESTRCTLDDALAKMRPQAMPYLHALYDGVFPPGGVEQHFQNHCGYAFAGYAVEVLRMNVPSGAKILDIGAGFGSCVLLAREAGYDASGVELSEFEVRSARTRLAQVRPGDDPGAIYSRGDVRDMEIAPASVDAVTFWNVMEHIDDYGRVLDTTVAALKRGGALYLICPNYAAFRQEAHYQVPWSPFLRGERGVRHLRKLGRDPRFFRDHIFYRTNWGVLREIKRRRLSVYDVTNSRCMELSVSNVAGVVRRFREFVDFYNPLRHSVVLAARKE